MGLQHDDGDGMLCNHIMNIDSQTLPPQSLIVNSDSFLGQPEVPRKRKGWRQRLIFFAAVELRRIAQTECEEGPNEGIRQPKDADLGQEKTKTIRDLIKESVRARAGLALRDSGELARVRCVRR